MKKWLDQLIYLVALLFFIGSIILVLFLLGNFIGTATAEFVNFLIRQFAATS